MKIWIFTLMIAAASLTSCEWLSQNNNVDKARAHAQRTAPAPNGTPVTKANDTPITKEQLQDANNGVVHTGNTNPDELIRFAETQIGVPYVYASCDPKVGFDCSGFITYVFKHFNIQVPRSSYGFAHMGKTVQVTQAKKGDIILFTGTDSLANDIGHIGLVVSNNNGNIQFIHSTSGKAMAVTVSLLDDYYKKRFVRISRVFPQNG